MHKNINKVSQAVLKQTPEFVEQDYPLFNKFLEYYYLSQEKTGMGQNILNNFLGYLDIDKFKKLQVFQHILQIFGVFGRFLKYLCWF